MAKYEKVALGDRWRYWFDGWMSRGTGAIMLLLALATALFVFVLGGIAWIIGGLLHQEVGEPDEFDTLWEFLWNALMRTLDAGAMAEDQQWWFRFLMLLVTIGGLVIVAALIGIVSGAFDAKLGELRQGRSKVIERDHTLILGWSNKVFTIVKELVVANESRSRSAIVILADQDKVEMEDAIRDLVPKLGRTKLVCRTGDPKLQRDIAIGNPRSARSVIMLAPEGVSDPDTDVIKTALALTSGLERGSACQIVGELRNEVNLSVAELAGHGEVEWVLNRDVITRIIVQCCRQAGLSVVYQELLAFEGHEFYFTLQPTLAGRTFFDAQLAFPICTAIGIATGDVLNLNPPGNTVIGDGDEIIVIAEDDSAARVGAPSIVDTQGLQVREKGPADPENIIVLGFNSSLPSLLQELDEYVAPGSSALIVTIADVKQLPELGRLTATLLPRDPTKREVLEDLQLATADHIIVLPGIDRFAPDVADNRTLVSLLMLRDMELKLGTRFNVVTEVLDDANRELAEVTEADDYIISDRLVGLVLAQVSEDRRIKTLYDELLTEEGSELYLRPAEHYVKPGVEVNFTTILEAARQRDEIAVGYSLGKDAFKHEANYGVRLNPPKAEPLIFNKGDRIIVLSEH